MKTKTLFYMALTAVMTTLAACSQDDELMDAAPKQAAIEFEITDGGYGGDEATRAKEEGFCTKFEARDECGLYIIDNGKFIVSNVKLTAEEGENGEITWKAADGAISGVTENSKYFLYYPYVSYADSRVGNALGDKDTEVFKELIANWSVYHDQSTYTNYTQSDLMTATGTPSPETDDKLKVSFRLTHRMALAIIKVPETIVYTFTNTDVTIPTEYTVPTSVEFNDGDSYLQPLPMADGTYRCIVNPEEEKKLSRSIAGTINGSMKFNTQDLFTTLPKEQYKIVRIGGANAVDGIKKKHNLQAGDYLMKDGMLVGKDETLTGEQKANVAALVFAVGHNQYDNSDYSKTGIGSEKCHGYAVALQEAVAEQEWGPNTPLGCYPEWVNSAESRVNDWNGYGWTQKIRTAAGNKLTSYPAAYYAVYYGGMDAPSNSSGWFLPSIGQLNEVWQAQVTAGLFVDVGDHLAEDGYWSSSEDYGYTECVLFVNSKDNKVSSDSKEASKAVRAVLAF